MSAMGSILIIDDVYAIRQKLTTFLRQNFPNTRVDTIPNSAANQFLDAHSGIGLILYDPIDNKRHVAVNLFKLLQERAPNVPILLHCGCKHSEFDLLACISAGARGFLVKDSPFPEYLTAISTVMEGRAYLPNDVKIDMVRILRSYKMCTNLASLDVPNSFDRLKRVEYSES